jgi:predicted lipid-binding transport protein (Tim44 family)
MLRETKLEIAPADFSTFEQRLVAIQSAFGAEDFDRLRALATLEMASYFAEELAGNAKKGLVNRVSDVTFLQGIFPRPGASSKANMQRSPCDFP